MSEQPQNPQATELTAQQLSEQEGIRRDKLKRLVESGKNPYAITHYEASHHNMEITAAFETTLAKIHERVSAFLALPLKTISAEQLKAELNRIGSL